MDYQTRSAVEQAAVRLETAAADLFSVNDVTLGLPGQPDVIRLRGTLQVPADRAYPELVKRFRLEGYSVTLRRDAKQDLDVLLAVPGVAAAPRPSRIWINVVLYVLTVISTLVVGTLGSDQMPPISDAVQAYVWAFTHLWLGWPFSLSLMLILTGHELGHYFASRYFKVEATLPYFIPLPLQPLGTMGAFIAMKERMANRRQMLTIGLAGPLTGLVIAIPVVVIGLALSQVQPITPPEPNMQIWYEGNSILYLLLKLALFGKILPGSGAPLTSIAQALREAGAAMLGTFPLDKGYDVFIHPVATAGWAGLLVTAFNLLPVGQLDGGHILYSLIGQRARRLTLPIIGLCLLMGLVFWPGWLLWAALIFVFGQGHPDPLDDVTRLSPAGRAMAVLMLIIFVLTFTPIPMRLVMGELPTPAGAQAPGCLAVVGLVLGAAWLARRWRKRRERGGL